MHAYNKVIIGYIGAAFFLLAESGCKNESPMVTQARAAASLACATRVTDERIVREMSRPPINQQNVQILGVNLDCSSGKGTVFYSISNGQRRMVELIRTDNDKWFIVERWAGWIIEIQ